MHIRHDNDTKRNRILPFIVGAGGILGGLTIGFAVSFAPIILGGIVFLGVGLYLLLNYFEITVLGLLVIRSALDAFSSVGLPSLFAVGLILLTLSYVTLLLLFKKPIYTDRFWWLFLAWFVAQGLWVILLPFGGLGGTPAEFSGAVVEWLRLLCWVMSYLLVMQLKGRVHPERVVNWLFFSLIIPVAAALLQIIFPPSALPPFLVFSTSEIEAGSRLNGTLGHPNSFSTFMVLFICLALWKFEVSRNRLPWILLAGVLVFFLAGTKALGGLVMMAAFTIAYIVPRLSLPNLMGAVVLFSLLISFFVSSDFGRERLASLYETPLLNPHLDLSRTLLLAWGDGNSLNWRIAHWTYLIDSWKQYPILGYGLDTANSSRVSVFENYAHNDYVGTLVQGGIVGLTIFIGFIAAQFVRLFKIIFSSSSSTTVAQRALCLNLVALLIAISVAMASENILTHTTLYLYWFTLLAIVGWDWSDRSVEASRSS